MKKKIDLCDLLKFLESEGGLKDDEVSDLRKKYGKNTILEVSGHPLKELVSDTLKDPMIWFLVVISIVFFFTGETTDAVVLMIAIIPLVMLDAFLHWRTKSSTASLKGTLASETQVLRNGKKIKIGTEDIVPGDHVLVSAHEYLPADGVFTTTNRLQIDESPLTGEALPVLKKPTEIKKLLPEKLYIEELHLGFAGTRVLSGEGVLFIHSTGQRTEYADIIQAVTEITHEKTPLQLAIMQLVKKLLGASFLFCFLLAIVRLIQGKGILDAFLSAASLAVAAIPEEFPVVFTFYLGLGVYRLAKRHVLVRKAVSVENIGRIDRICTDKTGTLTLGEFKVAHIISANGVISHDILSCALDASASQNDDPLDVAIKEKAIGEGIMARFRERVYPFTEDRKRETALIKKDENLFFCTKGAPETILKMTGLTTDEIDHWRSETKILASDGHKVIACAKKESSQRDLSLDLEPNDGFKFLGLLALEDPAREGVRESMRYCHEHGIKVLMITGDHIETANAVAREIGIAKGDVSSISLDEIENFSEEWAIKNLHILRNCHVIARCRPIQKLQIVKALKSLNEIVAVTGDGVNDVPALKIGDISIAMGVRGTRSAREVSHLILTDDNFSSIVNAIAEGRQLFVNLRKSFEYLILFHVPFIFSAALIPLFGHPLLFLPVHIVWLELLIHPTAILAFQDAKINDSSHSGTSLFSSERLRIIFAIGLMVTVLIVGAYLSFASRGIIMWLLSAWSFFLIGILTRFKTRASKIIGGLTLGVFLLINQISLFAEKAKISSVSLSQLTLPTLLLLGISILFMYLEREITQKKAIPHPSKVH